MRLPGSLSTAAHSLVLFHVSLPLLVSAQTIKNGEEIVDATKKTVSPAVENVEVVASASSVVFNYESAQLTSDILSNLTSLNLTNVSAFQFGDKSSAETRSPHSSRPCKVMPGDRDWPSEITWFLLDLLTDGALIKGRPTAAACYKDWPEYDEAACETITSRWSSPEFQMSEPTGLDFPLFEGVTCLPPSLARAGATCTLGGMPSYVLNVSNVAQVQLAVNFARNLNVRLNVKNKGHDFNGKSTGAGSLSIWLQHLQDIEYIDNYATSGSSGPALKLGAGVGALQVYEYADAHGVETVGGIARTVGVAGGYAAGGGHSPLASIYGMAADQILALQVVLPDGHFVFVDEHHYPDLFWALRGGGGSTFGVVTSIIVRVYPTTPVATLTYSFGTNADISDETFWRGIDAFWATFPDIADAGHYRYFTISCAPETSCAFSMGPHWASNTTSSQLKEINAPFFADLAALGISPSDVTYSDYDGVLNAFTTTFPASTEVVGSWNYHTGSRLFPRGNWNSSSTLAKQSDVIRKATIDAGLMMGYNIKSAVNSEVDQHNAVNPAWRETLMHAMLGAVWGANATAADIATASKTLTGQLQTWRDASPGAGAYMNEADINEPEFQQSFYGSNYPRLYELKKKYDPWGLLYAITAVGSEDWYITDQIAYYPTQNGRLCPAK